MSNIIFYKPYEIKTFNKNLFGCAIPKDKKFKNAKKSLMFKSASGIAAPTKLTYETQIDHVHKQTLGTCFCEAATTVIEQWLWERTGKNYQFSRDEINDIAADSKGSSYELRKKSADDACSGGFPGPALKSAYNFNSNLDLHYFTNKQTSEICEKFKSLVDSEIGGFSILIIEAEREQIKQAIFENGPICVSVLWYKTSGGHCIVACKYDDKYIYFRNSWGEKTLVAWTWEDYEKYSMASKWGSTHQYDVCIKKQTKGL